MAASSLPDPKKKKKHWGFLGFDCNVVVATAVLANCNIHTKKEFGLKVKISLVISS